MLTIRRAQLAAFEAATQSLLRHELLAHLHRRFAERAGRLGNDALASLVDEGRARAAGYGLDDRFGLSVFVEMMLVLSPDFDQVEQNAWARDILEDGRCPAWFKRERLLAALKRERPGEAGLGQFPGMPISDSIEL